ncbi:MAG: hypothetical protein M3Y17_13865, partial [Actinomycetota bacterium]|nr:hypothetical protein [Actinomycetota bacterium]
MGRLRLIAAIVVTACAAGLAATALGRSSVHDGSATSAPVVTLSFPAQGAVIHDPQPVFSGSAVTAPGDLRRVSVILYRGSRGHGRPFGIAGVATSGSTWVGRWPRVLAPGRYTARAKQRDDAGHTGYSAFHT